MNRSKRWPSLQELVDGIRSGDRSTLARAITLVESRTSEDRLLARTLLERVLAVTGASHRIGVTGPPGVGKSTFLEALGSMLAANGHTLAVLAIDPSGIRSGGSILGDKTRMARLSQRANAFIRPSPSGGVSGGVARRTREAVLLCEAAGFEYVFVETIGVGQSELEVASMVDTFTLLVSPGSGDELQGIKRGVLELADVIAITKADDALAEVASRTRAEHESAIRLLEASMPGWTTPVLSCSAHTHLGIADVWRAMIEHRALAERTDGKQQRRMHQRGQWFDRALQACTLEAFRAQPGIDDKIASLRSEVELGHILPERAAESLLDEIGLTVE